VDLSEEDKDRLYSLFDTITTWSRYHSLQKLATFYVLFILLNHWWCFQLTWWLFFSKSGAIFYKQVTFSLYYYFGVFPRKPEVEVEIAWCDWLQANLNNGSKDPAVGQYSIEVIVGWSRERILYIVVIPLVFFLCCTTTFALVWSFTVGAHHSNVSAGFSIASYFAGLAGGESTKTLSLDSLRYFLLLLTPDLASFCCAHRILRWRLRLQVKGLLALSWRRNGLGST